MRQNIYDDEAFFAGYQELRAARDNFNNLVEQPALRALLPDLTGAFVLDLGCGFGDLAAYCVEQGAAQVIATDFSARMLAQAREKNSSPQIEYRQTAMEDLDFAPVRFDVVVSSLALHYVADYDGLVARVAHWLTQGASSFIRLSIPLGQRGGPNRAGTGMRRGTNFIGPWTTTPTKGGASSRGSLRASSNTIGH